jgi:hypothetical protein
MATASHFSLTSDVAAMISIMFKTAFPKVYKQYKKAFDAGVWFRGDDGPMMARAVIYKLQGVLHVDTNDVGPSVSFGVGKYSGGEMKLPQLGAKLAYGEVMISYHLFRSNELFRYLPGDVCIFYSSRVLHLVDTFYPLPQTQEEKAQKLTPGRIGSVFFFPKASFMWLQGKGPNWGVKTGFGRNVGLYPLETFDIDSNDEESNSSSDSERGEHHCKCCRRKQSKR